MTQYQSVPFACVELDNGFWHDRQEINRTVTIRNVWKRFEETGRFASFRFDWKEGMPHKPHVFYDSDVAKWIESAAYILCKHPDPWLEERVEELVEQIVTHQQEDGYFNVWFTVVEPGKRFQQRSAHELYCAGHLIEAAVAYYEATGRDRFLRSMCRYADCIAKIFMEDQSPPFATPGHEEIELALVRLYRCTGEERYLRLSRWFLDQRGNNDKDPACMAAWEHSCYTQSHLPVRKQLTAEGHAVRAGYLFSAMADVAYETGDEELLAACRALFDNIVGQRMYITGGVGSTRTGEAFTKDFDLPNATAYAETCAAIALVLFAQRMLLLEVDGRYADTVERVLYNGFLSGLSLDGRSFFYENPLEIDLDRRGRDRSLEGGEVLPIPQRVEVFDCSCCPPNVTRLIASIGNYGITYDDQTFYIHQYMEGSARWRMGEQAVVLRQETRYPAEGQIRLHITGARGLQAALRIPRMVPPLYPAVRRPSGHVGPGKGVCDGWLRGRRRDAGSGSRHASRFDGSRSPDPRRRRPSRPAAGPCGVLRGGNGSSGEGPRPASGQASRNLRRMGGRYPGGAASGFSPACDQNLGLAAETPGSRKPIPSFGKGIGARRDDLCPLFCFRQPG